MTLNDAQKSYLLAEFRIDFPEFVALSDNAFFRLLKRALSFLPGYMGTVKDSACDWETQAQLINLTIAHIISLYALMEREQSSENPPSELELVRTAQSLSEGGLSVSYGDVCPASSTPQALYDWLTRTAYGDQAKIILEKCLSGAGGVYCV